VRHYTNSKGLEGIKESGTILAHDNGRVYVEPANKKPLSPIEAQDKYSIDKGRGKNYVETDVLKSELEWVKNPRYHTKELTIKGDVILKNPVFTRRK
jgi:hypothetical protein